jgi:glycosyltransferase involved in cell wall biosynthesis
MIPNHLLTNLKLNMKCGHLLQSEGQWYRITEYSGRISANLIGISPLDGRPVFLLLYRRQTGLVRKSQIGQSTASCAEISMTSVSVAMATYNGSQYILRQLDSLAAQSRIPAELVITDDNSQDGTVRAAETFARTASFPVHVYRNESRLGYRANFMRAASLCQSELIAFCDQDDYWYPHKIAETVKPFGDPDVLLAYHNADVVTGEDRPIGSLAKRAARQTVLMPLSSGPWPYALGFTQVFRRSLLRLSDQWPHSQDGYGQLLAHDQWFFFLASVFGKIAYLDERLADYVQHGSNTYGWHKTGYWQAVKFFFRRRSIEYNRCVVAAENRAVILDNARGKLEGIWAERAAAGAEYYRKVASIYSERSTLYTSANIGERIKAFRKMVEEGGYVGRCGLGRKSLITDMCVGVPIGHLLRSNTMWRT